MKNKHILELLIILIFGFLFSISNGQSIRLYQTRETGIYAAGEKISISVSGLNNVSDSFRIRILKNNDKVIEARTIRPTDDSLEIFSGSFDTPCSVIAEVRYKGNARSLGLVVEPMRIRPGASAPRDFRSFWNEQKKKLLSVPIEVRSVTVENNDIEKGYICTDVEINCPGTKSARGYLVRAGNASARSMPIVLLVHAAGVSGSWCRSEPKNSMVYAKMGAICFDLNAHGMLNGQPDAYYRDLEKGELKGYWLQGITNRNDVYFLGMYLRLIRALDYLTSLPEWDRKRILVMGESQGGGQALVAAGLDRRVSAVVAIVPAMCDWFGSEAGRKSGWPQPFESGSPKDEMKKALPFFDAANILKYSKATIFAEIGLIDMTCPSTSVYAAVNQSKGKKIIYAVPYRPHQMPEKELVGTWEETVYKPRQLFISNYLK